LTNPYQSPSISDTADDITLQQKEIRVRLSRPATALLIMSSIHSVFPAIAIVSIVMVAFRGDLGGSIIPVTIGMTLQFIFLLAIAIGAAKMGHLESYRAAKTAAVLSCIPGLTPFGLLGIPFGIWSLRLLSEPAVKAAFPDGPR
jgi:hypothetical protein